MGFLFESEEKFINQNVFIHEERINSQYSRFLDKTPSYVTYYHINNKETTTDTGFGSIERVLGPNSSLRFNEVKNFPIYDIDQIVLSLNDDIQGIDGSYEGEGIILPNTIKPTPNDMFTITYLNANYVFVVTEVFYDTIKSNNFYKIGFSIKSLNGEHSQDLKRQTVDKFSCISDNVGTKDKVLLRDDDITLLKVLNGTYTNLAEQYKLMFYNTKYNCFLYSEQYGSSLYDRYLTEFIKKHKLFNEKRKLETMIVNNEDVTRMLPHEYHSSIYRAIETQNKFILNHTTYYGDFLKSVGSIFSYHRDGTIRTTEFNGIGVAEYFSFELIDEIKKEPVVELPITPEVPPLTGDIPVDPPVDPPVTGDVPEEIIPDPVSLLTATTSTETVIELDVFDVLIKNFMNNQIESIYNLDIEKLENFMDIVKFDHNSFIKIPIVLYIIRVSYNKFMAN